MSERSLRRAGLLRRHRRPGLQEDLPVAAGDGASAATSTCRSSAWPRPAGTSTSSRRARQRQPREARRRSTRRRSTSCCGLLRYVDGDYNDPATFQALRKELGRRQRPAHYLAIPPVLFGTVVEQLGQVGLRAQARASSSRSRSAATSPRRRRSTRSCCGTFDETVDLPHRPLPRQAAGAQHAVLPLRQLVPRADLEPQPRRERADHDGRGFRRPGPRRVLRADRHDPRRGAEPSVPGAGQPGDGAARPDRQRVDPRREGRRCSRRSRRSTPKNVVRGQFRGYRNEPGVAAGFADRDLRRAAAGDRFLALAGRAVLHPRRQVPAGDVHRGRSSACAARRRCIRRLRL